MDQRSETAARTPLLEWLAAGTGLVLLLLLLGTIGYDALQGGHRMPPDIVLKAGPASRIGGGYVLPFEVINHGGGTAASLEVEGRLVNGDKVVETSTATMDYVAGHGSAEGGLFFVHDPKDLRLELRPLGFQTP